MSTWEYYYHLRKSTHLTKCKLCLQGIGKIDYNELSQTEAAKRYGVSRRSVGRHNEHAGLWEEGNTVGDAYIVIDGLTKARTSDELKATDKHRNSIILSQSDSEWEVMTSEGVKVLHSSKITTAPDLTQDNVIKDMMERTQKKIWGPLKKKPTLAGRDPNESAVLLISDAQIGKGNQRGGGSESTVELLMKALSEFEEHLSIMDYKEAALVDVGDIIESFMNFNGQREQNDLDLSQQIETAFNFMCKAIYTLSPLVEKLKVVSVPSNHCEIRMGKKDQLGSSDNDYGLLINRMLETVFKNDPTIEFIRPKDQYLQAEFELANTKMAVFHGHNVGNINSHAKWWKEHAFACNSGADADILFTGHFHSMRFEEINAGRWIIHCPTAETGSDSYANSSGINGTRSVLSLIVKNGMWYNPHLTTLGD